MKYKVKGKGSKENKSAKTSHCVLESAQKISADTHSKKKELTERIVVVFSVMLCCFFANRAHFTRLQKWGVLILSTPMVLFVFVCLLSAR